MFQSIEESVPRRTTCDWNGQSQELSSRGNAVFLAAGTLVTLSIWLWASFCAWAQEVPATATEIEVLVYGREQAIVEAIGKRLDSQFAQKFPDDKFPNDLDRTLSVLLAKAYPKLEARDLVRPTLDAVRREVEILKPTKIPDSMRTEWVNTILSTRSFEVVLKEIEAIANGAVNRKQLVNTGLPAMLQATRSKVAGVLSVSQAEWLRNLIEARDTPSNERGTLGVDLSNWPTIKVLPDTLAAESGLRDGDVVLRVNSKEVAQIDSTADALRELRGTAGSEISVTIERGDQTLTLAIRRSSAAETIKARMIDPGIIFIKIPLFEGSGIAERVNELVRTHVTDETSAVILDLRDNNAGRPEETNGVADIFLDEKYLQIFQFRDGRRIAFKSKPGALDVRVIVLTNRNTASCAEMLALALRDNQRATVIGQTTAGALCGKQFEKLADGRMITFRSEPTVLSPAGQDYSETGLTPDIIVDVSKVTGEDKILSRAIDFVHTRPRTDTSLQPTP